jgi:deoxyribodipyrimidine photo-lyase
MTALVWFTRDLRVHDNPALRAALASHERVVPVFCLDDRLLAGRHASRPRTQFLLESLHDLDSALRDRGTGLVIRRGPPERELSALARDAGATQVYASDDVSPFATRRADSVARALSEAGVELVPCEGLFVVDDLAGIETADGDPYTVFTPFHRSWASRARRELAPTPRGLPALPHGLDSGRIPSLTDLGLKQSVAEPAKGGERAGRDAMHAFLRTAVSGYDDGRNALGQERSSRLSPYLHFGCVSARELESKLPAGAGGSAYRRQLCWRDFFAQVLLQFPGNARREHQPRYRGSIRWSHAEKPFEAWCEGRTGFPLVDAGMRQLLREGWMHNRARLVVGSFLTKDLGIDWRWGERHFMSLLLDGDEASNNGNWQWIASVGVDPQPVFRRIFSPARQQARFDPAGGYVRRYVPELRGVPDRYLAEPASMPAPVQREAGCAIGADYPEPIVDHAGARREALERYRATA